MIDHLDFMRKFLWITNVKGRWQHLTANYAQTQVHKALEEQRGRNIGARAIVLKARREGVSTYVQGRIFSELNQRQDRSACVCSADEESTRKVFKMARRMQDKIKPEYQLPTKYSSRREIEYEEPHNSHLLCQTAGKEVLGRGGLTHYLHCSEFAFWQRASEQLLGVTQEVPDHEDSLIVLESTANGVGGCFHDMYWNAVEDLKNGNRSGFIPIFLPWFIFPDYQKPTDGYICDAEETEIQEQFQLTDEQMAWRSWAIRTKCQGDIAKFKQEYPATEQEAFQATGRNIFSKAIIDKMSVYVCEPRTAIVKPDARGGFMLQNVERRKDCWQIWHLPTPGHSYAIGIDTSEGKLTDPREERSERDFHGAVLYNRTLHRVDAIFHGRCQPSQLASQSVLMGRLYNDAVLVPEINGPGIATLQTIKESGYERVYNPAKDRVHWTDEEASGLGFRTTAQSRPILINHLIEALTGDPPRIHSADLLNEMTTFYTDKTGKEIHRPGYHDDLLFGLGLALEGHASCPMNPQPYPHDESGEEYETEYDANELASAHAVDTWEPGDDEEADEWTE